MLVDLFEKPDLHKNIWELSGVMHSNPRPSQYPFGTVAEFKKGDIYSLYTHGMYANNMFFRLMVLLDELCYLSDFQRPSKYVRLSDLIERNLFKPAGDNSNFLLLDIAKTHPEAFAEHIDSAYFFKFLFQNKTFWVSSRQLLPVITDDIKKKIIKTQKIKTGKEVDYFSPKLVWARSYFDIKEQLIVGNANEQIKDIWEGQLWLRR